MTNRKEPSQPVPSGPLPVVEDAVEPELPICDCHHHLWFPPNKKYLVDDFVGDIGKGHHIVKTIFVESMSVGPRTPDVDPLYETKFIHEITQKPVEGQFGKMQIAAGIVGCAFFEDGAATARTLERHLEISNRFRGIRQAVAWNEGPRSNPLLKGITGNPKWREGFSYLGKYDLVFDAMIYNNQLTELLDLARAFPNSRIILNHMATPRSIGTNTDAFKKWQFDIKELATCQNVYIKLGGLGMIYGHRDPKAPPEPVPGSEEVAATMAPYFLYCIEQFGCNRCMFESNFPVDGFSFSYNTIWNVFKRVTEGFSKTERGKLFYDTAIKVYRI